MKTIKLTLAKETKNTVKYDDDGLGPNAVTTVYVMKHALPRPFPQEIKLTLEWTE